MQSAVWHRIGIDLVGPLPEASSGNKYTFTCTDYFSKWPQAAPLQNKSAEGIQICSFALLSYSFCLISISILVLGVAEFLYDLTRYGVAQIVMSDQGREFINKVNQELFLLCGRDHRISSAYHPQTNGLDERMNQILKGSLVKFVTTTKTTGMCTSRVFYLLIERAKMIPRNSRHFS